MTDTTKALNEGPTELTMGLVVPELGTTAAAGAPARRVVTTPTQIRRPWQATIRTAFQALVALATLIPLVLTDVYDSPDAYPAVIAQVVFIAGLVSRIMANPAVEEFLRTFAPFLAAAPAPKASTYDEERGAITPLLGLGVALAALGLVLWLATVYDSLGVVMLIVGVIMVVVATITGRNPR